MGLLSTFTGSNMKPSEYLEPLFEGISAVFMILAVFATIGALALSALMCYGVYELIIHIIGG